MRPGLQLRCRGAAESLPSKPRVLNLEPKSLGDVLRCISDAAEALGHPQKGTALRRQLEQRITAVGSRVAGLRAPTVFVMEWADPIFNAGHWTPELVRLARGVPVLAAEGKDSVRIAWEELRAADPDVLIIACCGHTVERALKDLPVLESLPAWQEMQAVRNGRVFVANGSAYFSRPGPRIVDTLEMIAAMLHPLTCRDAYPDRGVVAAYGDKHAVRT